MISKFRVLWLLFLFLAVACSFGGRSGQEFMKYDPAQYERVSLNYQIYGTHDTTLVFIHGWNLDYTYWEYPVKQLRSRYRIVTLDLAGHGESGRERLNWTVESFARDISGIIQKEKISKAILIGHAMGSEIALEVAAQIPEKIIGLIAVEGFKNVDFELTSAFQDDFQVEISKFKRNYVELADAMARKNIRSDQRDVINRIVKSYRRADPKIALAILQNVYPKYAESKRQLQNLNMPLKIIASDFEPFDEDALKKYASSGYEIIWIKDAGHFPMVEQPQEFMEALEKLLAEIVTVNN